ncbi:MAG: precorrin-8X methylmutase [Rhodospirillales bacterium]|nr:precorrin-8X methylmutase [Rhodospirillales bacterium]
MIDYIRDPLEIYKRSFELVRAEADLSGLLADEAVVAVRLVHACGMPDITGDLVFSKGAVRAGRKALQGGAVIFADAEMVSHGIIQDNLPAANEIRCMLNEDGVRVMAPVKGITRSAAAVDLWGDDLAGAVVAIGNAPTALFRLLELIDEGAQRPAVICGFPVGFVGAAESKEALIENAQDIPFITLRGRRGGSALAAACVNALVKDTT